MGNQIIIHEDTCREGEQAPGNTMYLPEKIEVAKNLETLGVDVIQAGFPVASDDEKKTVRAIAEAVTESQVSALARVEIPRKGSIPSFRDIDDCCEYLKPAKNQRLHMVVSTSRQQNEVKWPGITIDDIARIAVNSVMHTFEVFGPDVTVQFSAEDSGRTPDEDLIYVAKAVIDAGAHVVNIADTVGYTQPREFGEKVRAVYEAVPAFKEGKAYISVHCHDRLGLAAANALAGIENGAVQVESCMLGLGDTGGLTATEDVVMALKSRPDYYGEGRVDHINTTHFFPTAEMLRRIINIDTSRENLLGRYSWSHESGMHASAIIKGMSQGMEGVYDYINPEDLGWDGERHPVGKHSRWKQAYEKLKALGYQKVDEPLTRAIQKGIQSITNYKNI